MLARAADIEPALQAGQAQRREWLAKITAGPRLYDVENCSRAALPIHPAAAITALRQALPRDGIVLVDSGAHRAFAGHYWTAYRPRSYISATNLGPMGWAIPAAVGVQCARPDQRVAVITGDGCMQMHGIDLQTAVRYRLPIVYVVINNGALGNVWLRARQYGALPAELTSIPDHDWAGFARAFGAQGFTVRDPKDLASTFAAAAGRGLNRSGRRQGGQGLPDAGLRFQRRRACLVLCTNRNRKMTVLDMNVAQLPADAQALYATMAERRRAKGEGFGGPYLALLNHPELARRIEELGFFLKFEARFRAPSTSSSCSQSRARPAPTSNGTTTSPMPALPVCRTT